MNRLTRNVTIRAAMADVFAYLDDVRRLAEWIPSLVEVHGLRGRGRRATWSWTYKLGGECFDGRAFVDKYEPPERLVVKTEGGLDSRWDLELTPRGRATRVSLTVDYALPPSVVARFSEPMVTHQNEAEAALALARLRELVELDVPQRHIRAMFAKMA